VNNIGSFSIHLLQDLVTPARVACAGAAEQQQQQQLTQLTWQHGSVQQA
jgi:hypothetical protein